MCTFSAMFHKFMMLLLPPYLSVKPQVTEKQISCWKVHMEVFSIVAQCRKRFAQKFASTKFHEKTAKICESYTKRFPILFPECSITRKQHVLSIVAPKQIRQQQIVYKILKLVERGENLHCKLNKLDRQYVNMINKADRMFFMMKEYETSLYIK